ATTQHSSNCNHGFQARLYLESSHLIPGLMGTSSGTSAKQRDLIYHRDIKALVSVLTAHYPGFH
ncbi:MAG: hypothetical protein ACK53L_04480, partial [Pirellulaceae bacterium]